MTTPHYRLFPSPVRHWLATDVCLLVPHWLATDVCLPTLVIGMMFAAFSSSLGQEIATDCRTTNASASSGAETGLAFDGLPFTGWSSATHADALHTESLSFGMDALRQVNYLKITPRTDDSGQAIGFPVNFSVEWAAGKEWNYVQTFSHVPRPADDSAFTIRMPLTVTASGLRPSRRSHRSSRSDGKRNFS